ncbi:MAG: hypothetical protein WC289_05260, partial [Patescibacteria group bacterium]
ASLSVRFSIPPTGSGFFVDQTMDNIIGHKDADSTLCPGSNLYTQLPAIRQDAQARFQSAGEGVTGTLGMEFVQVQDAPLSVKAGTEKEVNVEFKNTGTATWRIYGSSQLVVESVDAASTVRASDWPSAQQAGQLSTPNVAPGETGTFAFTVKAPSDQIEFTEQFRVTANGSQISGGAFPLTMHMTGFPYAATLAERTLPIATLIGARPSVTFKVKNEGTSTWSKSATKLSVTDMNGAQSVYYDASWPARTGGFSFQETEVKPGALATFTLRMKSPATPGLFMNVLTLSVSGATVVNNEFRLISRVDPTVRASLVSHTIPPAFLSVWRKPVSIVYKNTGVTTWTRSAMTLRVYDLGDRTSLFRDRTWRTASASVQMTESSVKPGSTATFTFILDAPSAGLYRQLFRLVSASGSVISGSPFDIVTRVD